MILLGLTSLGLHVYNLSYVVKIEENKGLIVFEEERFQQFLKQMGPLQHKDKSIDQSFLNNIVYMFNSGRLNSDNVLKNYPELKGDGNLLKALLDYVETTNEKGKDRPLNHINLLFPEFFIINQSTKASLDYYNDQKELANKQIKVLESKIISKTERKSILFLTIWGLLILFFGLRYIVIVTVWAIKTLKDK